MNKVQILAFQNGYDECRNVMMLRLRAILNQDEGHALALKDLVQQLSSEAEKHHLRAIQEELPGITKEKYREDLASSAQLIKETFYNKNGFLNQILTVFSFLLILLSGCGSKLCPLEYYVNNQWQQCSYDGINLRCGDLNIENAQNVQSKAVCN